MRFRAILDAPGIDKRWRFTVHADDVQAAREKVARAVLRREPQAGHEVWAGMVEAGRVTGKPAGPPEPGERVPRPREVPQAVRDRFAVGPANGVVLKRLMGHVSVVRDDGDDDG